MSLLRRGKSTKAVAAGERLDDLWDGVPMKPLVDILEAAYRFEDSEAVWLRGVAEASRAVLDDGQGILFYSYRADEAFVHLESTGGLGCPEELLGEFFAPVVVGLKERQAMARAHRSQSMQMLSAIFRPLPEASRAFQPRMQQLGFADVVVANATDPSGKGCVILAPVASRTQPSPKIANRWSQIAAHVAAGKRIRHELASLRATGKDDLEPEAVLDPDGHVQDALGPAASRGARNVLREAAIRIDRARGRLRKTDPEEAVSTWRALTAGRWTLLDRFDRDGRRYLVAHRNDPHAPDARALTLRERQIVGYAALGHSNKLIAYEMGLHASSVARHLRDAGIKLQATSRVELILRYADLTALGLVSHDAEANGVSDGESAMDSTRRRSP
jgi:DNA-binding CsgD family transcriptional regulator